MSCCYVIYEDFKMCEMKVFMFLLSAHVASVLCQGGARDIQALYLQVYGTPPPNPSGIVPEGSECKTADDLEGECLMKRKCQTDGVNGIAKAIQSTCSRIQVCCPVVTAPRTTTPSWSAPPSQDKTRETTDYDELTGCGISNTQGLGQRILGKSDDALFTEFPWMVAIFTRNETRPRYRNPYGHRFSRPNSQELLYTCGGALIHQGVVLTAAHCVMGKGDVKVRAGDWDLDGRQELHPHQERMTSKVIIPNSYNSLYLNNDVALLILDHPFTDADNIGVICLPPAGLNVKPDSRCMATGWGQSHFGAGASYQNILKVVELPIVRNPVCQDQLRPHFKNYFRLHHSFMCAGGRSDEDTCKGDGGSPLICSDGPRYAQHGIVSWGIGCGNEGTPGVYTNVAKVRRWIDSQMLLNGFPTSSYSYSSVSPVP